MHLTDADLLGDLGLRHVVEETQLDDRAVHARAGRRAAVRAARGARRGRSWVVRPEATLERRWRRHCRPGVASSDDDRYAPPTSIASSTSSSLTPSSAATSGHPGRSIEALRQLVDHVAEPQVQLLGAARHPDRPRLVAEVALQLAFDGCRSRTSRTRGCDRDRSARPLSACRGTRPASRSSNGSPRFAKRRARCDASDLCASISSLRSRRLTGCAGTRRTSRGALRASSGDSAMSGCGQPPRAGEVSVPVSMVSSYSSTTAARICAVRFQSPGRTRPPPGRGLRCGGIILHAERDVEVAVERLVEHQAGELVDRDPQILDFLDVESEVVGDTRRCQSHDTDVLQEGGDRDPDGFAGSIDALLQRPPFRLWRPRGANRPTRPAIGQTRRVENTRARGIETLRSVPLRGARWRSARFRPLGGRVAPAHREMARPSGPCLWKGSERGRDYGTGNGGDPQRAFGARVRDPRELDASNVDDVLARVSESVPNEAPGLVLDLTQTDYLDSAGVRILFDLASGCARAVRSFASRCPPASPGGCSSLPRSWTSCRSTTTSRWPPSCCEPALSSDRSEAGGSVTDRGSTRHRAVWTMPWPAKRPH